MASKEDLSVKRASWSVVVSDLCTGHMCRSDDTNVMVRCSVVTSSIRSCMPEHRCPAL
jgi:hypothetical protein